MNLSLETLLEQATGASTATRTAPNQLVTFNRENTNLENTPLMAKHMPICSPLKGACLTCLQCCNIFPLFGVSRVQKLQRFKFLGFQSSLQGYKVGVQGKVPGFQGFEF